MADARRLAELGMVPPLAKEVADQITAGVGNVRRLAELTMVPQLAGELAAQINAKTGNVRRLVELTMVPGLAKEVVAQIGVNPPYVPTGILMAGFEATNEWSQASSKTVSLDSTNKVQGQYGVKYVASATSSGIQINRTYNIDPATLGTYAHYVYVSDDLDWQSANALSFNIQLNGTGTVYGGASKTVQANIQWGGIWLSGNVSQMAAAVNSAGLGNHIFRMLVTETNALVGEEMYDAFYRQVGDSTRPGIIITGDDAKIQQYTILYPAMKSRGIHRGLELYPPTGLLRDNAGGTATFSYAEAKIMSDDGVSIQVNGTSDDLLINAGGRTLVSDWIANLAMQRNDFVSRGFPTPISFCYPFGYLRQAVTRVERTGLALTAGTNILPMASTTGLSVGDRAILRGVSRSCTITAIDPNVSVTLSENMTFTATNNAVSFVRVTSDFHGTKPQLEAIAAGWKWGRSTISGNMFIGYGISRAQSMQYPSLTASGLTLAAFQSVVNQAIAAKAITSIYVHDTTEWPEMLDCLDWLKIQVDNGLIDATNTPMLEARYGNATVPS